MKKLLYFSFIFLCQLSFSQTNWKNLPDPETTAKVFMKDIDKLTKERFLEKYSVTKADMQSFSTEIKNSETITEDKKKRFFEHLESEDGVAEHIHEQNTELIDFYNKYAAKFSGYTYIDNFYQLKVDKERIGAELRLDFLVKDQEGNFYKIRLDDCILIDKTWKPEHIKVNSSDKYGKTTY